MPTGWCGSCESVVREAKRMFGSWVCPVCDHEIDDAKDGVHEDRDAAEEEDEEDKDGFRASKETAAALSSAIGVLLHLQTTKEKHAYLSAVERKMGRYVLCPKKATNATLELATVCLMDVVRDMRPDMDNAIHTQEFARAMGVAEEAVYALQNSCQGADRVSAADLVTVCERACSRDQGQVLTREDRTKLAAECKILAEKLNKVKDGKKMSNRIQAAAEDAMRRILGGGVKRGRHDVF